MYTIIDLTNNLSLLKISENNYQVYRFIWNPKQDSFVWIYIWDAESEAHAKDSIDFYMNKIDVTIHKEDNIRLLYDYEPEIN